jgi:hypothetical protein
MRGFAAEAIAAFDSAKLALAGDASAIAAIHSNKAVALLELDRFQLAADEFEAARAGMALPTYSPELIPVELVWLWLKEHQLSNRVFVDQDGLEQAAIEAWNSIDEARFRSLCPAPWLTRQSQS